jgi:hypothetical protein
VDWLEYSVEILVQHDNIGLDPSLNVAVARREKVVRRGIVSRLGTNPCNQDCEHNCNMYQVCHWCSILCTPITDRNT